MIFRSSRFPIRQILLTGWMPSALKIAWYRLKGAQIGKNVAIGLGTVIIAEKLSIGDNTQIGFATILRGREISIGSHTTIGSMTIFDCPKIHIGDDAKINEQVFVGGNMYPDSLIHIGDRTIVQQYVFLNPSRPLIIGDGTAIGGKSSVFTHSSWKNQFHGFPVRYEPVTFGKNVMMAWHSFVMPGVTIGDDVMIGPSSVVNKDIPPRCIAGGVPAKVLRTEEEYLVRPDLAQQEAMMNTILSEFAASLEYDRFVVEYQSATMMSEGRLTVHDQGRKPVANVFVRYGAAPTANAAYPRGAILLTLQPVEPPERQMLKAGGVFWLDNASVECSSLPSAFGEMLSQFLKRYGVVFRHIKEF